MAWRELCVLHSVSLKCAADYGCGVSAGDVIVVVQTMQMACSSSPLSMYDFPATISASISPNQNGSKKLNFYDLNSNLNIVKLIKNQHNCCW